MVGARVELKLTGRPPFRRFLALHVQAGRFCAALYAARRPGQYSSLGPMLAWASDDVPACRLSKSKYSYGLWIGIASFDVSDAEAKQIRDTFEPLGLRFVEEKPDDPIIPVAPSLDNVAAASP